MQGSGILPVYLNRYARSGILPVYLNRYARNVVYLNKYLI